MSKLSHSNPYLDDVLQHSLHKKQAMGERSLTKKQGQAIWNMRYALGYEHPSDNMPKTLTEASSEIKRLHKIIENNLAIGGSINPAHSPLIRNYDGLEE